MAWNATVYIGECRPWPDGVDVTRTKGETLRYVPERTCKLSAEHYSDGTTFYTFDCCNHVTSTTGNDPYVPRFCDYCGARVVER